MGGRSGQKISPPNPPNSYDFDNIEIESNISIEGQKLGEKIFKTNEFIPELLKVAGVPFDFNGFILVAGDKYSLDVLINEDGFTLNRSVYSDKILYNKLVEVRNKNYNGLSIFSQQVEAARVHKLKRIETYASRDDDESGNSYIGYYVWLRYGYTPQQEQRTLRNYKQKAQKNALDVNSVTSLMETQAGQQSWKAYGDGFDAEFDLATGSYSMDTLNKYRKSKGLPKIK